MALACRYEETEICTCLNDVDKDTGFESHHGNLIFLKNVTVTQQFRKKMARNPLLTCTCKVFG